MAKVKEPKMTYEEKRWALAEHLIDHSWQPDHERIEKLTSDSNQELITFAKVVWGNMDGWFYLTTPDREYWAEIQDKFVIFKKGNKWGTKVARFPIGTLLLTEHGVRYGVIEIAIGSETILGTIEQVHKKRSAEKNPV